MGSSPPQGTGGGGGPSEVATGTHTVDASSSLDFITTTVEPGSNPRLYVSAAITANLSNLSARFTINSAGDSFFSTFIRFDPDGQVWEVVTAAPNGSTTGELDVSWTVYDFS